MRKAALVVGVDEYEDPGIDNLRCAESDATELYAFLKRVAGYEPAVLLRRPASAEVLDCAAQISRTLERGDSFVFYFAGHGVDHTGRHLLLCPKARLSRLDYLQEVVPVDLLKKETETVGIARVLILDACRGRLYSTRSAAQGLRGERGLRDVVAGSQSVEGSLAMLCSCGEGEQAKEIESRGQGLFTAALLDVFEDAARTGAEVSLSDVLEGRLREGMSRLAEQFGLPGGQRPWIQRLGPAPVLISGVKGHVPTPQLSPPATPIRPIEVSDPLAGLVARAAPRKGAPPAAKTAPAAGWHGWPAPLANARAFRTPSLKDLVEYAYSVEGLNYGTEGAAQWADQKVAFFEQHDFEKWRQLFEYAYSVEGLNYGTKGAAQWADQKVAFFEQHDFEKWRQLYEYAYSVEGLNYGTEGAVQWADTHMDTPL